MNLKELKRKYNKLVALEEHLNVFDLRVEIGRKVDRIKYAELENEFEELRELFNNRFYLFEVKLSEYISKCLQVLNQHSHDKNTWKYHYILKNKLPIIDDANKKKYVYDYSIVLENGEHQLLICDLRTFKPIKHLDDTIINLIEDNLSAPFHLSSNFIDTNLPKELNVSIKNVGWNIVLENALNKANEKTTI